MHALADAYDVRIIGGDTNVWDGPVIVSVTLLGSATDQGPVLRSGARPGDWLMVTGPLGGSLSGRHLDVRPRVREALRLHAGFNLQAMLDISDGLSRDVRHITVEQGVGAIIDAPAVPIHADVPAALPASTRLSHALHDGEDFELLFAISPQEGARLSQSASSLGLPNLARSAN
ncbi:MAG: thiamine-phosphate kinase [Planctomycetaceae bacterium]